MPKIRTILSAALVLAGTLGGSSLTTAASVGSTQLHENVNDEFFRVMRLDPYAGMVRLRLVIPEGQTLKRIVVARPSEDRYRLMPELDAAALKILDGEVEELVLYEQPNPGMMVLGKVFDNWVGFSVYDYTETGRRFLEWNPADVVYVGVVLEDVTGEETRYYYKLNYRSCAHEQAILDGGIVMCEAQHDAGVTYFVPEGSTDLGEAPTWEEELLALAESAVREYFERLEVAEAVAKNGEIDEMQIEELEAKNVEMDAKLARFPKSTGVDLMSEDYAMRVEALKRVMDKEQGPNGPTEDTRTEVAPGNVPVAVSGVVAKNPTKVIGLKTEVMTQAVQEATETEVNGEAQGEDALVPVLDRTMDQDEVEVPKLGGSWAERYGLATLIAGASLTGVAGWFLIGLLGKKRKRNNR